MTEQIPETVRKDEHQSAFDTANMLNDDTQVNLDRHNKNEPSTFGHCSDTKDDTRRLLCESTREVLIPVEDRVNWTDADIIRKCQGGTLRRGIYCTKDIDELVKEREIVIDVKDSIESKGPVSSVGIFHKECSSEKLTQIFQNNTDKSSCSRGFSGSLSFYGVSAGAGYSMSQADVSEKETINSKHETYMAVVHYEMVPVKSFDITPDDLYLMPRALKKLQTIEKNIKHLRYKSKGHFQEFFKIFGSHVTSGVVEFGGILMSTASYRGFKESDRSKVTSVVSDVSRTSLNMAFSKFGFGAGAGTVFTASKLCGETTGKYNMKDLENIEISLRKIGGPEECHDKVDWRRLLVSNNSLWRVINRDSRPIPLWEILENHHKDCFEECVSLANAMQREWEDSSGISVVDETILKSLRRDIFLWQQYETENEKSAIESIKDLAKIRNKQIIKVEDWFEEVLYLPVVQEKIARVVEIANKKVGSLEQMQILTSLRTILHPLNRVKASYFKDISEIKRLINNCISPDTIHLSPFKITNIVGLPQILKNEIGKFNHLQGAVSSKNDPASKLKNICLRLETTITAWRKNHPPNLHYLVCIAVFHLHGFSLRENLFDSYLDTEDICEIVKQLDYSFTKLNSLWSMKDKQAFLLSLALNSPHQKQESVQFMIDTLSCDIDAVLASNWAKVNNASHLDTFQAFIEKQLGDDQCEENLHTMALSIRQQLQPILQRTQTRETVTKVQEFVLDESADQLLRTLQMKQYYPQKLTYDEVITLTSDILDVSEKPQYVSQLPWYFMRQVIGLDSSVREGIANILNSNTEGDQNLRERRSKKIVSGKRNRKIDKGAKYNPNYHMVRKIPESDTCDNGSAIS